MLTKHRTSLLSLALLFERLGTTAFGGPAAHIAMMEDEVVRRRKWMTREEFLDLLGATNLIPGPNSTELAIHIGHRQAGVPGLLVAGISFILPAVLIVERWHWLSETQLLDAIAVGQVTPGPVFTTATFVGYVLAGTRGAMVATLGIFLPAFVFVAVSGPLVPRIRKSEIAGAFLDGVNVAALALMLVVTYQLGRAAVVDEVTLALALISAFLLFRFRINSAWLILGGAIAGWALYKAA